MVKSISIGISLIIFIIWILDILLTPNIKKNEKFSTEPRKIITARHLEPYSSWKNYECDDSYEIKAVGIDIKKENSDCSDCDVHEDLYFVIDEKAVSREINKKQYDFIKSIWGNEIKVEMKRDIVYNEQCGMDGDMYFIKPNKKQDIFVHSVKAKSNDWIHHLFFK